ncbi:AraC family transcriptional regulator [Citrobacter freundii]|uniref:AraC family transcriptional regulator n=1 Tax=Citrobacter freundii TaxID=546 RepID=UPI0007389EF5|nr:helix-turn-helix transcriptional regulator [Citrobacter freundii]MBM7262408.1 helix-turn-helix transcriptional regulator [Citrobacter freundii]QSB81804.1 helix-turn-helix transcriptional regulator [Citrobacter freundii]QSB96651.1 helix-turn-helix transcriptional regulator [Citrobacter freundii]
MEWTSLNIAHHITAPNPLTIRKEFIPANHCFPEHKHKWHQVVYATAGDLMVKTIEQSFLISPKSQAVWLPAGTQHQVGSSQGAYFNSLWIANDAHNQFDISEPTIFDVSPFLKALILEISDRRINDEDYIAKLIQLILYHLENVRSAQFILPWPQNRSLVKICESLCENPSDTRSQEEWCHELGMSERTLSRRFTIETGMSLRSWKKRLRLMKAIELLDCGKGVTETAIELGYSSSSAFVYAFHLTMGHAPLDYMKKRY